MSHLNHRKCAIWRYAQNVPYMIFQPNGMADYVGQIKKAVPKYVPKTMIIILNVKV